MFSWRSAAAPRLCRLIEVNHRALLMISLQRPMMVCHLSVCTPAWYLERSWRLRENEGKAKSKGKKNKSERVGGGEGGSGGSDAGVRQMTQVMKWPPRCAGSSHVRLCSLPLSGHYPSPEFTRGFKFTSTKSIRAGGAGGGRTGTVGEVKGGRGFQGRGREQCKDRGRNERRE